jgi:hypothetical protein
MNETLILEHLEDIAIKLGVELRYEDLGQIGVRSDGGYCKLAGRPIIIINRKESRSKKISILAKSLNKLNLEGIFIPSALRKLIESHDN